MAGRASKGGKKPEAPSASSGRRSGKAVKKHPKLFDPIRRRLVTKSE
jgi:hypothetical protein